MKQGTKIYTVGEVNTLVKMVLQDLLPDRLIVRGEISGWKHHLPRGHCYFSLKDETGVLACVMWADKFRAVRFRPEDGMAVLATGYVDVYIKGGKYQLYVEKLEPEGIGALQLAFEQMVRKLRAEGLFDEAHKRPIPQYPERISILTSESGAAVHDITDSIHNRWPCVKLFLYPVPVQGEGAAEQIAFAIRDVNKRNRKLKLDLLIVGRGGGSLEDLWAFNEEVLARAIFDSEIPIISAVGHEVDVTVADLVADARASTPTKAGVVAVPDMRDVLAELSSRQRMLTNDIRSQLQLADQSVKTILASSVFRNPLLVVRNREQQLDETGMRLADSVKGLVSTARQALHSYYEQVVRIEPHRLLAKRTVELKDLQSRTNAAMREIISRGRMQLLSQDNRLAGLNPKSVLRRGYSITRNRATGTLVKTVDDIQVGDSMATELAGENLIESKVTRKSEDRSQKHALSDPW